ncbi:MAG: UDP-glucose 4-epimerase, partial [Shewanella sp.]
QGVHTYNLGTGQGYNVLQLVQAFSNVSGKALPYDFTPRRAGYIAQCWADPNKALQRFSWQAQRDLTAEQAAERLRTVSSVHYKSA